MIKGNRYTKGAARISRRGEVKRIFNKVLAIGLPTVFLVGLVLLLRADFLQVKNFEVSGATNTPNEEIKNLAQSQTSGNKFLLIPKTNLFFINKGKLAATLLSQFNRLEKVEINKQFFSHEVELKITERKNEFLWCSTNDECFFMDKNGLVFASSAEALAKEEENVNNEIIFKGRLEGDPLMKNFATSDEIQNFLKLISELKASGFEVRSVSIESGDRAVAETKINNYISDIIFNPAETDLAPVAQNVILLINETLTKDLNAHFNYIDARFGNKIFYKLLTK